MTYTIVMVVVVVPLYWYYILVLSLDFCIDHCIGIGIMYPYWAKASDDIYYFGGCGNGTIVLVLCIGFESRLHKTNIMAVVVVVVPLYWYYGLVLSQYFSWKIQWGWLLWCYNCIGSESTIYRTNLVVLAVVVVPLYLYYVLALSQDFAKTK